MSKARLKQELAESKTELDKLKEEMSSGMHTVHKDLSLLYLVPKWSGAENATSLEEFLASIDRAASIGKWQDADGLNIAVIRIADSAKSELPAEDAIWQEFKKACKKDLKTCELSAV